MKYTIREIKEKDNKEIEKVIRSCLIEFGGNHEGTAWTDPNLDKFSYVYSDDISVYYVVEDEDGVILGGAGIGPIIGSKEVCELQKMYLLPSARGKKISQKLMELTLEFARTRYKYCYIETMDNMFAAQKLYESYGFRISNERIGSTGHDACPLAYIKKL